MFAVSMPNFDTSAALVETATKCSARPACRCRPLQTLQRPRASGAGVGHRLERREGLRGDDEQRLGRIEIADGFGEVGAVDIRYEAERHGALAVVLERLVGHHGPEIRAADADVDDVADALAGVSFPVAAADAVREVAHPVEHRVDLRHHVLAIHDDRMRPWAHATQCAAQPGSRRR